MRKSWADEDHCVGGASAGGRRGDRPTLWAVSLPRPADEDLADEGMSGRRLNVDFRAIQWAFEQISNWSGDG